MKDDKMLSGILLAITLIETAANATVMIGSIRAKLDDARAEGRDITLFELAELQKSNQRLTEEVLDLLETK